MYQFVSLIIAIASSHGKQCAWSAHVCPGHLCMYAKLETVQTNYIKVGILIWRYKDKNVGFIMERHGGTNYWFGFNIPQNDRLLIYGRV